MRLTILARLMIGYFIVFSLALSVSVYAILRLHQYNQGTRHIINIDNRILDYEKKLTDSILSQLRYEKKFFITKDMALYNQFLVMKDEFDKYLREALAIADTPPKRSSLERVRTSYGVYQSLIIKEVEYIKTHQDYSKKWYEVEKEKVGNDILKELEMLVVYSQEDIQDRTKMLKEFGTSARTFAVVMSIAAILLGIGTSYFLTRRITKPLSLLMEKTQELSEGVYKNNLNIFTPPEISELTKAFNLMAEKLQAVDKMKTDFFASMSHELRTPLTSIKEGVSLLQDGVVGTITDKQRRLLTILTEESNRVINLVNSFLDLSKMEAGMATYTFEPGSLVPLIERTVMEMVPIVEAKKINLETQISGDLPILRMDKERILQALRNLIGNAVKFTSEGGYVKVSAQLRNREVEVTVADTGPGIPKENLITIFEKYKQSIPKSSDQTKGTGLGLSIVKHIIAAHGGRVWAESKLGQGSSFIFVLPS